MNRKTNNRQPKQQDQGYSRKPLVVDDLQNLITNMNTGTDRLQKSMFVPTNYIGYQEESAMYLSWLGRRIVDLPVDESLKKGWNIVCPSWDDKKIERLKSYCENKLQLTIKVSEALKSERCFGGALTVAIISPSFGSFQNEVPAYLPHNTLLGIQSFDAWQCAPGIINHQNALAKNFRLPETYSIGSSGIIFNSKEHGADKTNVMGTIVHYSRTCRYDGLFLPWIERMRNLYWGQSVLASVYTAVRNSESVDSSIASLLFRASVPVLKVQDLMAIVSDEESRTAFLQRVNLMNYGMSNNNMAIIDANETLESFEPGSISNLDSILERFYVTCSAASGIPVTKLVGESARGLNATGEGDLNNYYDFIEDYQNKKVRVALIDIMKRWVVPSFFNELLPSDFSIDFPALERQSPKEKQQSDSDFMDMINKALENGLIDKEVARREILRRKVFSSYGEEDVKRIENETQENEVDLNHALDHAEKDFKTKLKRDKRNGKV